jgi:hypothetical protein
VRFRSTALLLCLVSSLHAFAIPRHSHSHRSSFRSYSTGSTRHGRYRRSTTAKNNFKREHPFHHCDRCCPRSTCPPRNRSYRRSIVATRCGIVATSKVSASQTGALILVRGGSAIDAAIAANAVLNIAEPIPTALR